MPPYPPLDTMENNTQAQPCNALSLSSLTLLNTLVGSERMVEQQSSKKQIDAAELNAKVRAPCIILVPETGSWYHEPWMIPLTLMA